MKKLSILLLITSLGACSVPIIFSDAPAAPMSNTSGKSRSQIVSNLLQSAHLVHIQKFGGIDVGYSHLARVEKIVTRLSKTSRFKGKTIIAHVLKSNQLNASSLHSEAKIAYIYITQGMIDFAKNDDEVAFILAHELAHINLKKPAKKSAKQSVANELAADRLGAKYMVMAGYKIQFAIQFIKRLAVKQSNQSIANASFYPSNSQRLSQLVGS